MGKKGRKRRDLAGGLGSCKEIVGTGRVSFWVLEGDSGYWKGSGGKKGDKKEGFGVLERDCGSWKGQVLGTGRPGFRVMEGSGFGSR